MNDAGKRWLMRLAAGFFLLALHAGIPEPARAEYGDVVINNYSDAAGVRPAVFPHWFHRVRFRCKVCHSDLGFKFKERASRESLTGRLGVSIEPAAGARFTREDAALLARLDPESPGRPNLPRHLSPSKRIKRAATRFAARRCIR